ncbi:ferritin light chain [Bacillus rossius redtenbacheri]|uniref:ferritin light chain n=1 Tax=Bacillus rossius redtenbacheri TaxID=93214 RepID=UPI002FDE3446
MKVVVVFCSIFAVCVAFESCYTDVVEACNNKGGASDIKHCDAKYGAANMIMYDLQSFANDHITRSFQYLLTATHFDNYEKNREGFTKLFRKLSDTAWEDGIKLIKYITKRGGQMNFSSRKQDKLLEKESGTYEIHELGSLSRALDVEKSLAEEAHNIHSEVMRRRENYHDPEVGAYLEDEFLHREADRIRELAGYFNDLEHLVEAKDPSLSVFLFDEHLNSIV